MIGPPKSRYLAAGCAALLPVLLISSVACFSTKKVRPNIIAFDAAADASNLARLALTLVRRTDVRAVDVPDAGRMVFRLSPAPPQTAAGDRMAAALDGARRTLASLPRWWRRPSLARLTALRLDAIPARSREAILDALEARYAGDPMRAVSILRRETAGGDPPALLIYEIGASLLEAGDLSGGAEAFSRLGRDARGLPKPFESVGRAAMEAAAGRPRAAYEILTGVITATPSLVEARWLRAHVSRSFASLYDRDRIAADLRAALRASPCCPSCALAFSESQAFAGRPEEASALLAGDDACAPGAIDSARARARALALAADGKKEDSLSAAADAESRDASPLRSGLAPVFVLAGDHAHLDEAYDSEGDARLSPAVSAEQHLHSGLNDLWVGKPSAAAVQFERAEEHVKAIAPAGPEPFAPLVHLRALRIRAYLAGGRVAEAGRAAAEARDAAGGVLDGYLSYVAARADIAADGAEAALDRARRLGSQVRKFWRYMVLAEADLAKGRPDRAYSEISLALQGVNTQVTIAPGIPVEPHMLDLHARVLMALGRRQEATRLLERILGLGARGFFAPDVVVPAWALLGEAREALGDRDGAAAAYSEFLSRWGSGETIPAVARARERLDALAAAGGGNGGQARVFAVPL